MLGEQTAVSVEAGQDSPAYRDGWHDGRFDVPVRVPRLAGWSERDRQAYHRGYGAGRDVRQMLRIDVHAR